MNFEKELETVYPELVRYARYLAGSDSDGDDILQEALIKAWKAFPRLKDIKTFRFWMFSILRNTYRTWVSRKKVLNFFSLDKAKDISSDQWDHISERDILMKALNVLPYVQREAIILYEVNGYSVAEIERIQNAKASAVKSRLARGRKSLKDEYNRLLGKEK